jgi:hypothetical protein
LLISLNVRCSSVAEHQQSSRQFSLGGAFRSLATHFDIDLNGRGMDTARLQKLLFPDKAGTLTGCVAILL